MTKSIIQQTKEVCFICGASTSIRHHIYHGTGLRQVSEREGLWVYLCHDHHRFLHDLPSHPHDEELKIKGQRAWIGQKVKEGYSKGQARGMWLNRIGRFFE
jgi:hypothetical protein